jgi:hypothetical protein
MAVAVMRGSLHLLLAMVVVVAVVVARQLLLFVALALALATAVGCLVRVSTVPVAPALAMTPYPFSLPLLANRGRPRFIVRKWKFCQCLIGLYGMCAGRSQSYVGIGGRVSKIHATRGCGLV